MFSEKVHRYLFLFGLYSLALGMMIGTVPTSVPQFILLGNWLIEGDFKRKFSSLRGNKILWCIISIFLLHVLGLLYTSDLNAGLNDLRIKLPLLFLPVLFFTSKPIDAKELKVLLYCFLAGSVINTAWCLIYAYVLHNNEVVRNASRFMSHIRLGLYLNLAIASCVYFIFKETTSIVKFLFALLLAYFIFVMYALGLASGLVNLFLLFVFATIVFVFRQKTSVKIVSLLIVVIVLGYGINTLFSFFNYQLSVSPAKNNTPKAYNATGNVFTNREEPTQKENGNYVFINIQTLELQREWKRRFPTDSFSYMPNPHNLQRYNILIRYMASKGLDKDSLGLTQLNNSDLENIKNNITNYEYPNWSFIQKRMYEFVGEYDEFMNERDVNGHSLTMRLYFWKAAFYVIKKNILIGVGTGDVQTELNKAYIETHSPLSEEWYKRPHNQFITILVSLGVIGIIVFLFGFLYPVIYLRKQLRMLFWPYFVILFISFILEDTLETQAGLSFYAFFFSLFVSLAYFKKQQNPAD